MKKFEYVITDPAGIHARPAGMLGIAASTYKSIITIEKDGNKINVKRLMALMTLAVKCGETAIFTIEGEDEDIASTELETFCKENL